MLQDFRHANRLRRLNRFAQIFLALGLLVLINLISQRWYRRFDLSEGNRFSLSAETEAYLRDLPVPVEIYVIKDGSVTHRESEMVQNDLDHLLAEYEELAARLGNQRITVETADWVRQHQRAKELGDRFDLPPDSRAALVVASEDRYHQVEPQLLYDKTDDGRHLFKGERAVTSAILQVSEAARPVVYFLTGHGEMRPDDVNPRQGMSETAAFLKQRNWEVRQWQLTVREGVPADASLLVIAGPRTGLLPIEARHVRQFLEERDGRVLLMVDPMREHGMDELLSDWGILMDDMLVVELDPGSLLPGGDIIISHFAEHPITDFLFRGKYRLLFGATRPARADPAAPPDANRKVTPLMGTSPDASWAESGYRQGTAVRFNPESDLPGPISVAVASERQRPTEVGAERPAGRMVVVGNTSVFTNERLDSAANLVFFNQVINWLSDRDAELLQIPPREWRPIDLSLSQQNLQEVWLQLLYLPGGAFFLAGVVTLLRRR